MQSPATTTRTFDVTGTAESLYDQDRQQQHRTASTPVNQPSSVLASSSGDHWVTIGDFAERRLPQTSVNNCAHELFMPGYRSKLLSDSSTQCSYRIAKPGPITHCMHYAFETVIMAIISVLAVIYVLILSGYNPYGTPERVTTGYEGENIIMGDNANGNPIAKNAASDFARASPAVFKAVTSTYDRQRQIESNLNAISYHLGRQADVREAFGGSSIENLAQSRAIIEKDVLHIVADFALKTKPATTPMPAEADDNADDDISTDS